MSKLGSTSESISGAGRALEIGVAICWSVKAKRREARLDAPERLQSAAKSLDAAMAHAPAPLGGPSAGHAANLARIAVRPCERAAS